MSDIRSIFVDSSEQEIATLGGNYLQNFLAGGVLDKGFCAVSDKRVYFKGKCYTKSGAIYKATKEERTVDLKDITGTGFVMGNLLPLFVQVLMLLFSIVGIIIFFSSVSEYDSHFGNYDMTYGYVFLVISILLIVGIIVSYFKKQKLFEISFAGGKIAFKASNYNEQEIQEFQKSLRRAKDNYTSVAQVITAQPNASVADELKKYKDLLDSGVISQEEFDSMKAKLLK